MCHLQWFNSYRQKWSSFSLLKLGKKYRVLNVHFHVVHCHSKHPFKNYFYTHSQILLLQRLSTCCVCYLRSQSRWWASGYPGRCDGLGPASLMSYRSELLVNCSKSVLSLQGYIVRDLSRVRNISCCKISVRLTQGYDSDSRSVVVDIRLTAQSGAFSTFKNTMSESYSQ